MNQVRDILSSLSLKATNCLIYCLSFTDIQGSHCTLFELLCYQNIQIAQETFLHLFDAYQPIKNTVKRKLIDYRTASKPLKTISSETNQFLRLIIHSFPKQGISQRYYRTGNYQMKLHSFHFQDEIRKIDNLLYEAIGEKFISHFQFIPENNLYSRSHHPSGTVAAASGNSSSASAGAAKNSTRSLLTSGNGIKSFIDMSNIMNHMINNNIEVRDTIYEYYENIIKWERINFAIKSSSFKVGLT